MSVNKKVYIIGATGLIGKQLVEDLLGNGYHPCILARNPSKAKEIFGDHIDVEQWRLDEVDGLSLLLKGSRAVVNLAGESIASRWTKKKKLSILSSRVETTRMLVSAINKCLDPPNVFIQGSAIGFYSHNSSKQIDESGDHGNGFLSQVVMQWESAAREAEDKTRLVNIRTGIVLSKDGGMLKKLMLPIRCFVGNWFGKGDQILSWIHIKDHVRAIRFLIEDESCKGVYNLVSPEPTTYKHFVKRLGLIARRLVWLPIPVSILKILFGEMADEVILANQSVVPKRLMISGFKFQFENIEIALTDLLKKRKQ